MIASSVLSRCSPRFQAGLLSMSPYVTALVENQMLDLESYLARHLHGDWGDVSEADRKANVVALRAGCRLLSSYDLARGLKLKLVTDASRKFTTATLSVRHLTSTGESQ